MADKYEKKSKEDQAEINSDSAQLVKLLIAALNDLKPESKPNLVGKPKQAADEYKEIAEALRGFTTGGNNRWKLPPLSIRADTGKSETQG